MFSDAKFELPDELPELVTIYRGTSKLPFATAKRGYSWTTDRQAAAFFATRFAEANGQPLVLRATVPKSSILFYSDERAEREAVCFHVRGAKPDGNPEEWKEQANQYQREAQEQQNQLMEELKRQFQQEINPCPKPSILI